MTLEEKLVVIERAAEAGFFGARPSHDYHATGSYSEEERQLLKRWAYLARALVDLSVEELTRALWRLTGEYSGALGNAPYFPSKVERALRGGVEPEAGTPWTPLRRTSL